MFRDYIDFKVRCLPLTFRILNLSYKSKKVDSSGRKVTNITGIRSEKVKVTLIPFALPRSSYIK